MGISTTLAITVSGGVHQKTRLITLGTSSFSAVMAMFTEAATLIFMHFCALPEGLKLEILLRGKSFNFFGLY